MNFRRRSIRWLLPALLLGCLNLTAPAMAAGGLEQARTQLEQGRQLMAQGDYQKAAVLTRTAREAFEQLKASGGNTGNGLARAMMQLAHLQVLLGQTEPAHALASQSLGSLDNANDPALMAELLLEMGEINFLMGHSVAALSYAQMVLTQMPSMPAAAEKIRVLSRISRLYYLWGRLDMALARLKEALQLAADSGSALACELYLQRGEIELGLGQQAAAKADVEQAQALIAREPDRARQGELLLRLAQAYQGLDAPEPAAQAYRQALALLQELPLPASQALYGLGELRRASGQYAQALDFYRQALARVKHLEHNLYLGPYYSALGQTLLAQGQLQPAIENLETAVNFLKQFDDAAADTQREYYEKLAPAFEALSQAYVRAGDADKALEIVENTRGLFFFQMLWQAKHGGDTKGSVFSAGWNANVYWFRESFPEDTTLLNYAVPASGPLLQFRLQDRQLSAQESDIEVQLRKDPLYQSLPPGPESGLTRLIKAYRQQLITPGGDQLQLKQMSQLLYRLLIGPHEAQLKGHHTLLIAPDGELGLLPFETLRNAAGEYLIENFDIQYIQSLSILKELEARNYAPERKPMLALGAPEYQEIAFEREPVESADQLLELKKLMWLHPDGDMREIY
ncbi:MAG: CHAT domain-containing protein, partial [Candidatus Sericytochromatia bacterium]